MGLKNKVLSEILFHKECAQTQADLNLARALKDKEFKDIYLQIKDLEIKQAKESNNTLCLEIEKLHSKAKQALKKINMTFEDFAPKYDCLKCQDKGYIDGKLCRCFEKKLNEVLTQSVGISINKEHTFQNVNQSLFDDKEKMMSVFHKIEEWCDSWETTKYKNLLLSGKMGVGKTYLVECVANKLLSKDISVNFYSAFALNNLFLKFHTCFEKDKFSLLESILNCDVLIVDDLGTEPIYKNVTEEYLYLVINERLVKNKSTIITTNLGLEDILSRYGARIFSRVCNKSSSILLKIENTDMRLKK